MTTAGTSRLITALAVGLLVACCLLACHETADPSDKERMPTAVDGFAAFQHDAPMVTRVVYLPAASRTIAELEIRQRKYALEAESRAHNGELVTLATRAQFDHWIVPGDFEGSSHGGSGLPGAGAVVRYAGVLVCFFGGEPATPDDLSDNGNADENEPAAPNNAPPASGESSRDTASTYRLVHLAVREPDIPMLEFLGASGDVAYYRLDDIAADALARLAFPDDPEDDGDGDEQDPFSANDPD